MSEKISEFVVDSAVTDSSLITYVKDGQNFTVTQAEYVKLFGLTGTIVQDGAVTGTPILDTQGTVNNIRNLEDGSGILTSVSPENGAEIAHNFQNGTGGVQIVGDITEASPIFRPFVAGSGISISESADRITVAATGGVPITNTVVVTQLSDFPTPVANVITLENNKTYLLLALVDISPNRILFGSGNSMLAENRVNRGLTSTTTDALITVSGTGTPEIVDMILNCPNGKILDVNSGSGIVLNNVLTTQQGIVSTFTNTGNVSFRQYSIVETVAGAYGCLWSGTCTEFNSNNGFNSVSTSGHTIYDFGTAVFTRGMIIGTSVRFSVASGSTAISGATASANIGAGSRGLVTSCTFDGAGTILSGISRTDDRWQFTDAGDAIADTTATGIVTQHGNAVITGITTQSVPVRLVGTWVATDISQITGSIDGRMTYTGQKTRDMGIVASFNIERVTAGTKTYRIHVALNGTVITNAFRSIEIADASQHHASITWIIPGMVAGDFVELFASNETDTDNVLVSDAIFRTFNG